MAITINDTPATVDFVLNHPGFKITSNASPVKLVARIFIYSEQGGSTIQIPDVYLDPDSNDSAVFQIEEILQEYFDIIKTDIYSLAAMALDLYSLKKYYIEFYEWNGTVLGGLLSSGNYYLLYGRLFYQDWPGQTWFVDLATTLDYLNNLPSKINTWFTAKQYLYWLHYFSGTDVITLRGTIYYTDKTTVSATFFSVPSSDQYDVLVMPTGYTELAIAAISPTKTVYRYDVELWRGTQGSDSQVGKTISYYIKNKPWWAQEFLFRNDYGVLEAVIAEGKETTGIKANIETSEKRTQYDYAALDFQKVQRITSRTKPFTANIGPLTRSEAEHLEEMLNDKLFKVGDTKLIPCNILSSELKTVDQSKDLQVIEFKYQYAFNV